VCKKQNKEKPDVFERNNIQDERRKVYGGKSGADIGIALRRGHSSEQLDTL
jgi:hypothetical protein